MNTLITIFAIYTDNDGQLQQIETEVDGNASDSEIFAQVEREFGIRADEIQYL